MNSLNNQDNTHLLPGEITSIEPQQRSKKRYSIFVDENYVIGISESVLLSHHLESGMKLTKSRYFEIRSAENRQYARDYFLHLLSRRDHTRRELERKAFTKQIDSHTIEILLDEFEEKGWIDHSTFTDNFIEDKFRINRWGPRKIISALAQKGIDLRHAEKRTNQHFESIELLDIFRNLVDKKAYKFKRISNQFKLRKKVFDYLARKGYYSKQIMAHIDRLTEDLQS